MKKIFLIASIIGAFTLASCGGSTKTESKTDVAVENSQSLKRTTIKGVQGLCEMCKDKIETTAKTIKGVQTATWDAESKNLVLESSESVDVTVVSKAIANVGYDTQLTKADDKVYEALPACCQYRN